MLSWLRFYRETCLPIGSHGRWPTPCAPSSPTIARKVQLVTRSEARTKRARLVEVLRREPELTSTELAERLGVSLKAAQAWAAPIRAAMRSAKVTP